MKERYKCAIIGLGRIGSTLEKDPLREKPASHSGAAVHHPETYLAAGADPDPAKRREFEADWSGVRAYDDPAEMLSAEKPDIVHIASWTDTHPRLLDVCLGQGIPTIVCEKPLANSLRASRRSVRAARRLNSRVIMNHERRFSADYRDVRNRIRAEEHGELLSISARLFMGRTRPAEEVLYHDGTHMIDIIRFLTGSELAIDRVRGDAGARGGGLEVAGRAGGATLNWELSGGRDHLVFELDLSFSMGRIRIGNGVFEIWESAESPYYSGFRSLKKRKDGWTGDTGYFSGMMNHAVALTRDPRLPAESSIEDGHAALESIEEVLRKAR